MARTGSSGVGGRQRRRAGALGGEGGASGTRIDLYDEVTSRIIAEMEAGSLPWVKPWGAVGGAAAGLPCNAVTARRYSGINILILWGAVIARGYPSQGWLTYRQALGAGGQVRRGEEGITICYADRFTPECEHVRAGETGEDVCAIPFLKRFTVFNVAQCDGLGEKLAGAPVPVSPCERVEAAEAVIAASGVDFRIGGDKAFYVPLEDYVAVPPQPAFFEQINYYRTALHELSHATGHPTRLGRNQALRLGSSDYAREELVAEMGSAFLCAALGIEPTVRHSDYIASWLTVLKGDNRAIFKAASAASKAADWLLSRAAVAPALERAA